MSVTPEMGAALAAAQAELQNPKLDSVNPHFKNAFASLAAVRAAVVPVFSKHGITVIQDLTTTERGVAVTTLLVHTSGDVLRLGPFEIPATRMDAQGFGSAATYARRYSLQAVAGVVGEEDDDGNAAVDKPAPAGKRPRKAKGEAPIKMEAAPGPTDIEKAILKASVEAAKTNGELDEIRPKVIALKDVDPELYRLLGGIFKTKRLEFGAQNGASA